MPNDIPLMQNLSWHVANRSAHDTFHIGSAMNSQNKCNAF
jgi:hypothetical protein